jgi:small multidrug resistance pump
VNLGSFPFVPESDVCMCWIWLFLAIFLEVAATVLMKLSNGLTRAAPTIGMFVLYGLSFIPMTIALKQMEIGTVYAIWSAVGTALVAVLGVMMFHEQANALKVVAIVLIIAGVVCLDLSSRHSARTVAETQTELRSDGRLNPPRLAKTASIAVPRLASASVRPVTGP